MRLVNIDELQGNEILAVPVVSNDTVLIHADTVLRGEYVEKLREYKLYSVYVRDHIAFTDDVQYTSEQTLREAKQIVKSVMSKHIYKHDRELKRIAEEASKIIESVISEPDVVNSITEIRNVSTDMYSHCINVCSMATIMAVRLKMNDKQIRNVSMGAILHDIGLKYIQTPYIDIDIESMSEEELSEYKKHTIYGYSSLQEADWLTETAKEIILLHHERTNGTGYPFNQKGDKLKLEVRLVALCDEFDSLISGIGNKKMKIYEAIEYIKVNSGVYFDAAIAAKFLETVAVYPRGTRVLTSEGEIGIVIRQNNKMLERPVLRMLNKSDGSEYLDYVEKDLTKVLTIFITDTV